MQIYNLWDEKAQEDVIMEYYEPLKKSSDAAVIIFPGGGYTWLADHEGEGYAQLLNVFGISAFVVKYRVYPNLFPAPLLDARRAIRFVRFHANKFAINKSKVLVMGSSAGGHLAALVSTYLEEIGEPNDALCQESFLPNGQILCYPLISSDESISHKGSYRSLLGDKYENRQDYSPELLISEKTPPAFIWHTANDELVPSENSYRYAEMLTKNGIACELHVFPFGNHGLGIANGDRQVNQWVYLLQNWLRSNY